MILSTAFFTTAMLLSTICDPSDNSCTIYDFTPPEPQNFTNWLSVTDQVRGGQSTANISSAFVDVWSHIFMSYFQKDTNAARFSYNLVPLPNGACFAGVYNPDKNSAAGYDGLLIKLRRSLENEWFKIIVPQEYSYEFFFKVCLSYNAWRLYVWDCRPRHLKLDTVISFWLFS